MKRDEAALKVMEATTFKCCPHECWIWLGLVNSKGYGYTTWHGRRSVAVHRILYQLEHGVDLTPQQFLLHSCDVTRCVNPAHLRIGTVQENADDMVRRKRSLFGERSRTAKLTEAQVIEILANPPPWPNKPWGGGEVNALAAKLGIKPVSLTHILAGRTWKHLPRPYLQGSDREK